MSNLLATNLQLHSTRHFPLFWKSRRPAAHLLYFPRLAAVSSRQLRCSPKFLENMASSHLLLVWLGPFPRLKLSTLFYRSLAIIFLFSSASRCSLFATRWRLANFFSDVHDGLHLLLTNFDVVIWVWSSSP